MQEEQEAVEMQLFKRLLAHSKPQKCEADRQGRQARFDAQEMRPPRCDFCACFSRCEKIWGMWGSRAVNAP